MSKKLKTLINEKLRELSKLKEEILFKGIFPPDLDRLAQSYQIECWDLIIRASRGYSATDCLLLGMINQVHQDLGKVSQTTFGGHTPYILIFLGLYKSQTEKWMVNRSDKIKPSHPSILFKAAALISHSFSLSNICDLRYGLLYRLYNIDRFIFENFQSSIPESFTIKKFENLWVDSNFFPIIKNLDKFILKNKVTHINPSYLFIVYSSLPLLIKALTMNYLQTIPDPTEQNSFVLFDETKKIRNTLVNLNKQSDYILPNLNKSYSKIIKNAYQWGKCKTESVYDFLRNPTSFTGVLVEHEGRTNILTSISLLHWYWKHIEAKIYDYKERRNETLTIERRNLSNFRQKIEEKAWNDIVTVDTLPNGTWIYDIPRNSFGNKRQIDFLGLFYHEGKYNLGIGDIKSITPSNSFTEHFNFYFSKLKRGREQVIDSKNEIKSHVQEVLDYISTNSTNNEIDFCSVIIKDVLTFLYVVPSDLYITNPDTIIITLNMNKDKINKDIKFSIDKPYKNIIDNNIHLFKWANDCWIDFYSSNDSYEIFERIGIKIGQNTQKELPQDIKEGNYKVFHKDLLVD